MAAFISNKTPCKKMLKALFFSHPGIDVGFLAGILEVA